jgi:peptidoglycan lytic transglycosylase
MKMADHRNKTAFKSRVIGMALTAQLLVGCAAATTVGGFVWDIGEGTVDVITGTFDVIGYLIPDGDPPPPPGGNDESPKTGRPYQIAGRWYYPAVDPDYDEIGFASWYGPNFHGRLTANGERFDMNEMTAAHRTLPLPSYVRVTNLSNGRSAILRVNDRGPFANNRILDVSRRGAQVLGFQEQGVQRVRVQIVTRDGRALPGQTLSDAMPDGPSAYYVQVASFRSRDSANEVARGLNNVGGGVVVQSARVNGNTVYRVRVGPFELKRSAESSLGKVRRQGHGEARVFSQPRG